MKLYILRHEDRTIDATFFSPLTEKGLTNANNLINHLEKLNITKIFCSPFIRTMQTVYPFAKKKNLKLNLDYNLVEIQHPSIIPQRSFNVELPTYIAKQFNYNSEYVPLLTAKDLVYPENEAHLEIRTKKFLRYIISRYYKTEENILIVTHQGLCTNILKLISAVGKNKPDKSLIDNYPTGIISLIFQDGEWVYNKIN